MKKNHFIEEQKFSIPAHKYLSKEKMKKYLLKNILLSKRIKDYIKIMNKDTYQRS